MAQRRDKLPPEARPYKRISRASVALTACALIGLGAGCLAKPKPFKKTVRNRTEDVDRVTHQLDNPCPPVIEQVAYAPAPVTALTGEIAELLYIDHSLSEVIETALRNSEIFRDIGGVVLRSPDAVRTNLADNLQQTDPQFGMEAALSQFDARLSASSIFSNNDRIYNNALFAGGTTNFQQDLHEYQIELSKRTATGSTMALRTLTEYDNNNAPANTFINAYETYVEGELRQPLLQGGGLEFNRIAGPGSTPGIYNGVLIARTNFDINHADFQIALHDFISNVENAYWDLYLSYRELDAKKKSMELALVVWNETKSQASGELINQAQEALARQHYYRLKSDYDEALSGRLLQGTQTRNGSTGGTLQSSGGVLAAERRLRLLIGLPVNDGTVIRPSDEPPTVRVPFNWDLCRDESLTQRPELQRQNATVKKRELELLASKNFLNPRLDAVGRYRYRGFGDDLIGSGNQLPPAPASAVGQMLTGDNQEWSVGLEMSMPVGFRQAHAAVTHAELGLSRARSIQREQQREIVSNLSAAFADADRAHQLIENKLNQYLAATEYLTALQTQKEEQGAPVEADRMVDAQERVVRAEVEFFRARAEYAVSLKNIHYEKGTILAYKDLRVAEQYQDETTVPMPTPATAENSDGDEQQSDAVDLTELPIVEVEAASDEFEWAVPELADTASKVDAHESASPSDIVATDSSPIEPTPIEPAAIEPAAVQTAPVAESQPGESIVWDFTSSGDSAEATPIVDEAADESVATERESLSATEPAVVESTSPQPVVPVFELVEKPQFQVPAAGVLLVDPEASDVVIEPTSGTFPSLSAPQPIVPATVSEPAAKSTKPAAPSFDITPSSGDGKRARTTPRNAPTPAPIFDLTPADQPAEFVLELQ